MSTRQAILQGRLGKGWTQQEFASELNVSIGIISRWERGVAVPRLKMLRRIAEATGRPLADFMPDASADAASTRALENLTAAVMAVLQSASSEKREALPVEPPARTRVSALGETGRPWADPSIDLEMNAGGKL